MIRGMTAYAGEHKKIASWLISAEIWSYNHKFLQIGLFIPTGLRKYSSQIEESIRSRLKRGKITLKVSFSSDKIGAKRKVYYNQALAKDIYAIGKKEKKKDEALLQMKDILLMPGVLETEEDSPDFEKLWPGIDKLILDTLTELAKIKDIQGRNTASSLRSIILTIENSLNKVKKNHKEENSEFAKKLKSKVKSISTIKVDRNSLQDEAINFIRNCDISEEVSRTGSYLGLLRAALKSKDPAGRKIDFIAQELLREVNTIGSKKDNFSIRKEVINIKEEVGKLREHSQNIE